MNTNVMFSGKTDAWATPKAFFAELDKAKNIIPSPTMAF